MHGKRGVVQIDSGVFAVQSCDTRSVKVVRQVDLESDCQIEECAMYDFKVADADPHHPSTSANTNIAFLRSYYRFLTLSSLLGRQKVSRARCALVTNEAYFFNRFLRIQLLDFRAQPLDLPGHGNARKSRSCACLVTGIDG